MDNSCQTVNDILLWRQSIGDVIQKDDYLDFSIPRTVEELANLCLVVNTTFASVGSAMRIDNHQGVIIPTVT